MIALNTPSAILCSAGLALFIANKRELDWYIRPWRYKIVIGKIIIRKEDSVEHWLNHAVPEGHQRTDTIYYYTVEYVVDGNKHTTEYVDEYFNQRTHSPIAISSRVSVIYPISTPSFGKVKSGVSAGILAGFILFAAGLVLLFFV